MPHLCGDRRLPPNCLQGSEPRMSPIQPISRAASQSRCRAESATPQDPAPAKRSRIIGSSGWIFRACRTDQRRLLQVYLPTSGTRRCLHRLAAGEIAPLASRRSRLIIAGFRGRASRCAPSINEIGEAQAPCGAVDTQASRFERSIDQQSVDIRPPIAMAVRCIGLSRRRRLSDIGSRVPSAWSIRSNTKHLPIGYVDC